MASCRLDPLGGGRVAKLMAIALVHGASVSAKLMSVPSLVFIFFAYLIPLKIVKNKLT